MTVFGDDAVLTPVPGGTWWANNLADARDGMTPDAAHAPLLSHRDAFLHKLNIFPRA